jgi:GR25 family glycosyltransferase involved in LPS biosynthesis
MIINVLNLDRRPDRQKRFAANNDGLSHRFHSCIDGPSLGESGLAAYGVASTKLQYYNQATIGNQLSHMKQWMIAATDRDARTIAEDDAVFHPTFEWEADLILETLPDDWDIMFWGWTFATGLCLELAPDLRAVNIVTSDARPTDLIAAFKKSGAYPNPHRAWACYNSFAYSISAKGASRLLSLCSPIKDELGILRPSNTAVPIYGVDAKLACSLDQLEGYVAFPPLAIHLHDRTDTDMLPDGAPIRDTREDVLPSSVPAPMTVND